MKLACMLRLKVGGELVRGFMDSDTGLIDNISELIYQFPIGDISITGTDYTRLKTTNWDSLYGLMLKESKATFAVDLGGFGFYCEIDRAIYFFNNEFVSSYFLYNNERIMSDRNILIGLRPTKVPYVSFPVSQFYLVYNLDIEKVITSDGLYSLGNLELSKFKDVDRTHNYMIEVLNSEDKFGLCNYDGKVLWLYHDTEVLKI